ncbi:MAG: thymidylate synthase [Nanoarchaeota archaeon]|nr:thymidylate synthase [Nanoarchaeota archaeon]
MEVQAISPSWPHYYSKMIHTTNKQSNVAILTLWSRKDIYIKSIPSHLYNSIGQLYSREEGVSTLIRNLCLNTYITDLVIVGVDLNHCADALLALFEKGVNEKNEILCEYYSKLDDEISKDAIQRIRENVTLHDFRHFKDKEELSKQIELLQKKEIKPYFEIEMFKEAQIKTPQTFPSSKTNYSIHSLYVKDAWIQILKHIMKFGILKDSQYEEKQRELITITSTITKEDPNDFKLIEEFGFTKEELDSYIPQVTSINEIEGLEYTYGQRLMNHKKINQIDNIIEQINAEEFTRRAVAFTWDVTRDYNSPKCPCLNLVQVLVQDNILHMTCYFRSNDMYEAWPRNTFALRYLQKMICEKTHKSLGNLTIISNSAHIYERSFRKVEAILEKKQKKVTWDQDPNGTIAINNIDNKIVVKHLDTNGQRLEQFEGTSAIELYKYIANSLKISDISHAMDIGCELQKAQIALEQNIEYMQDQPLKFN